jgi:hypothetical protein
MIINEKILVLEPSCGKFGAPLWSKILIYIKKIISAKVSIKRMFTKIDH